MSTEIFYQINFSLAITASIIGLIFNCFLFILLISNRQCRTINNLFTCDRCLIGAIYFILFLIGCFYGLREDWSSHQPLCIWRAYLSTVMLAASSYAFLMQAISRLFFTSFYKHKELLTWRTHWILIIFKWLISFLLPIEPFFIDDGFGLIPEYRMCGFSTSVVSVTVYAAITLFTLPVTTIIIIYYVIVKKVRQSTRRVIPTALNITLGSTVTNTSLHAGKRDLKVMRNILIMLIILVCGGTPFAILIIWHILTPQTVPNAWYLLSINSVALSAVVMIITWFFMDKTAKEIALQYLFRCRPIS